jgi:hypothetical protein
MHQPPSFQDIEQFVREFTGIQSSQAITPQTRLDADLGVTGDDGEALLRQAAERFGAVLSHPIHGHRETFSLGENEYLFHDEGFDPIGLSVLVRWMRNEPRPKVRDVTVAELHDAILRTSVSDPLPNNTLETDV